jgi:hypothetical protein
MRVGTKPEIKELWDAASIKRMWDYLTRNATDSAKPGYDRGGAGAPRRHRDRLAPKHPRVG